MAVYRVLRRMNKGDTFYLRGDIVKDDLFSEDALRKLLAVGAIAPVNAPPLAEIAGWEKKAKKLEAIGVSDVTQFIEADPSALAKALKVSRATILRWGRDLEEQVRPPERDGCTGCRD